MTYLRSLFLNFLIVFFVDRIFPGIEVSFFEGVPNIGADIVFSFIVGLLNSLIFPVLVLLNAGPSGVKIAIISFIISLSSFLFIAFVNIGIYVTNILSLIFAIIIVWLMSFFTNYLEMKSSHKMS